MVVLITLYVVDSIGGNIATNIHKDATEIFYSAVLLLLVKTLLF